MDNRQGTALALIAIGLVAVNFFYLSDLILLQSPGPEIVIGWKSGMAIAFANLLALAGLWLIGRGRQG